MLALKRNSINCNCVTYVKVTYESLLCFECYFKSTSVWFCLTAAPVWALCEMFTLLYYALLCFASLVDSEFQNRLAEEIQSRVQIASLCCSKCRPVGLNTHRF